MLKCVVFDWDGTLVDTVPFLEKTFKETFKHLNMSGIPYKEIRQIADRCNGQGLFKEIFGENNLDEAKKFFYDYTQKNHLKLLQPKCCSEQSLKFCLENKISCYILSNKKNDVLKKEVEYLGWDKYFNKISGAGDYHIDKPAKEACYNFFDQNPPAGNEVLVLGDSLTDIKMAKVFECPCVLVKGYDDMEELDSEYKLKSLEDFIPLLQSFLY